MFDSLCLQKSDFSPSVTIVLIASARLHSIPITDLYLYFFDSPSFSCLITVVLSSRASLLTPPSTCLQRVFVTSIKKRNQHSVGCLDIWANSAKRLPMLWPVMVYACLSVIWRSFRRYSRLFSSAFFLLAGKPNEPTCRKSNYDKWNPQCKCDMLTCFRQETIEVTDSARCVNFCIGLQCLASPQICEISVQQTLTLLSV